MLMRESPVQEVVAPQHQSISTSMSGAPFSAVTDDKTRSSSGIRHTASSDEADLLLTSLAPKHPALNVPLPREVVHQFDNEDFEPNPVFHPRMTMTAPTQLNPTPAPAPLPTLLTSTALSTALAPPQLNASLQQQHPPERLTLSASNPPVPDSISFSVRPPPPLAAVPAAVAPPLVENKKQPRPVDRKKQFLVFVKILMKHLEKNAEDRVRAQTKRVLTECIHKNRQGHPEFTPLHLAAEARILPIVGPRHWNRSVQYLNLYLKKEAQKQQQKSSSTGSTASASSAPVAVAI